MPRKQEHPYEGFVVGYARLDRTPRAVALRMRRPLARPPGRYRAPLRELSSRDADLVIHDVRVVGAACLCGWRSLLCVGLGPALWERSVMRVSPRADAVLSALWAEHAAVFGARAAKR